MECKSRYEAKYHFAFLGLLKIKMWTIPSDVRMWGSSRISHTQLARGYNDIVLVEYKMTAISGCKEVVYDPAVPLQSNSCSSLEAGLEVFITLLLVEAESWRQPSCPLPGNGLVKYDEYK